MSHWNGPAGLMTDLKHQPPREPPEGTTWEPQGGTMPATICVRARVKSCNPVRLCAAPRTTAARLPCPWDSPGKNTGVGCNTSSRGSSRPRDRAPCASYISGSFPAGVFPTSVTWKVCYSGHTLFSSLALNSSMTPHLTNRFKHLSIDKNILLSVILRHENNSASKGGNSQHFSRNQQS